MVKTNESSFLHAGANELSILGFVLREVLLLVLQPEETSKKQKDATIFGLVKIKKPFVPGRPFSSFGILLC